MIDTNIEAKNGQNGADGDPARRFPRLNEHSGGDCTLDGDTLTISEIARVSRNFDVQVRIPDDAWSTLQRSFDLVMIAAAQGKPIYGLTVGVGLNKDRPVFEGPDGRPTVPEAMLERSRAFNLGQLRAHGAGIGLPMPVDIVRAGLLVRLNQLLSGQSGAQPAVARLYMDFLNRGITPVVPSRGSVGAADITLAAHIGLAMIGEGEVFYRRQRRPALEAMREAGIEPLVPVGKDFLSIISTNSLTAAYAALLVDEAKRILRRHAVVFALTLEGFNGNIAPFLPQATRMRPFPGMQHAAQAICDALEGSYLWDHDPIRALQDPLSYRTMAYTLGNAIEAADELADMLAIHVNHSDDNPSVQIGSADHVTSQIETAFLIGGPDGGAVFPTANFEMLPIISRVERLNKALVRLAQAISMQTILFENPALTGLPRFLAAGPNAGHAFGAVQKILLSLYSETVQLGGHAPQDAFAMAGNIEDISGNGPVSVVNLEKVLDNLLWMVSIQLLHAAQAVDLRRGRRLAHATAQLRAAYRDIVHYVEDDRIFSRDIKIGYEFLRGRKFDETIDLDLTGL